MTKKAIRQLMKAAENQRKIINVRMAYNENYYNLIPVHCGERLFLSIRERDFLFDGFRISRFRDIEEMHIKDDLCDSILQKEGLWNGFQIPQIDLTNWETVFKELMGTQKHIIIEHETAEGSEDCLVIGKIDRVYKSCLYMYCFGADGIWDEEPCRIPYNEVTSVTFDTRYIAIYSKYVPVPHTFQQGS